MERLADALIIPAGPGDAAGLAAVHVRSWRETYPGLLPAAYLARLSVPVHARRFRRQLEVAAPADVVLAAEGPEGLVGYCAGAVEPGSHIGREAEIFTLYLLRSAQGVGLGRRLLKAAARGLEGAGAGALRIWVLSANRGARRFYDHLGGVAAADRPVSGWGGGLRETAYVWNDIADLTA